MAVYVDNAFIPFGRMHMSHMEADTLEELHAMAELIGLKRSWFQDKSIPHYDVSRSKRAQAVALGAIEEDCFSDNEDIRRKSRHSMLRRMQAQRGIT